MKQPAARFKIPLLLLAVALGVMGYFGATSGFYASFSRWAWLALGIIGFGISMALALIIKFHNERLLSARGAFLAVMVSVALASAGCLIIAFEPEGSTGTVPTLVVIFGLGSFAAFQVALVLAVRGARRFRAG